MATEPHSVVLTNEDYLDLPNDGRRYEILEGELFVTPAPGVPHQDTVLNLALVLLAHARRTRAGRVFVAPVDVLLSDTTIVQPDIVYVSTERSAIVRPEHLRGAPDLVVEVVSPTTGRTDRQVKAQVYARHGVPYYWLVDPARREILALKLAEGVYHEAARAEGEAVLHAPPFTRLAVRLAEVWE